MFTAALQRVGTWYRAFNLASALVKRGHSVSVVKVGVQRIRLNEEREDGVSVVEIPRFWGSSLLHRGTRMPHDIAGRIALQVFRGVDVVHAFTHHLNSLLPALVGRLAPGRVVLGDRDDLWADGGLMGGPDRSGLVERMDYRFHTWTERNMGRWLGTMTVVSDDLRDRLLATGLEPGRIRKIINGCAVDRIRPGDRSQARAKLGFPRDRSILLFVGVGQYDVDLILDALGHLKADLGGATMPLTVLVGPHEDLMRGWAAERGLTDHVVATGFLADADILAYLQAADVGLLPFADKPLNWARFPIKIGDYLAAGLPVLTNDIGEMGRIVREADVGEVTAADAGSYAAGLRRMLADRERLDGWRHRARETAERLSWQAVGADLEQFYLEMGAPS
jgi:glycosyltransferase involved in cell wall biosynthesis